VWLQFGCTAVEFPKISPCVAYPISAVFSRFDEHSLIPLSDCSHQQKDNITAAQGIYSAMVLFPLLAIETIQKLMTLTQN